MTTAPATQDIGSTARQTAWNYLTFGLSKASTLIMTVVVARLLTPADFGQFALALLVVNFFDYVKDLGVGAALVQSTRGWKRIAPTGFTLSAFLGLIAGGGLAALAPAAAEALNHPQLSPLIRVLALSLAIASFSAVPAALLRRNLDFRRRLWPESISAATKAAVTIALAVEGLGVWSLVYGQLAGAIAQTALYWWSARTPAVVGFDPGCARDLLRYGIPHSGATLLAFAIFNIDYLAIGIRLGDHELGLYTIAYRLPELLVLSLCVVVSEVLFSSLSRLQHEHSRLARQYLKVVAVVTALSAPFAVLLATAAPAVIGTLYGPDYAAAAPVLAVLSCYTLIYSMSWHIGDVFKALGRPSLLIATGAGKLAVMAIPVWWAAGHGIIAVAAVLLGVEFIHLAISLAILHRTTPISVLAVMKTTLRPLPAALCMGVAITATNYLMAGQPAVLTGAVSIAFGLSVYVGALRVTASRTYRSLLDAFGSLYRGDGQP